MQIEIDLLRVSEDGSELRDNCRKRLRKLARSTEGHGSQEFDGSLLGTPLLLLETLEKRGEDDVDAVTRKTRHHDTRRILSGLTDVGSVVAERGEQKRKNSKDIGFKDTSERGREGLEGKERTLPGHEALFVLSGLAKLVNEVELFDGRETTALDDSSKTVGGSAALGVFLAMDEEVVETRDEPGNLGLHPLDECRDTVRDGGLDGLRGRLERLDETVDDFGDPRVGLVEETGKATEELE